MGWGEGVKLGLGCFRDGVGSDDRMFVGVMSIKRRCEVRFGILSFYY